ncbi:unnamed protein product [Trifolium pratense]|uniref:Uncharacterized protein n=1 Tax=Trifolium pratense TaxID=57577 RepID=A0ACB0KSG8_TRIPR|nr:unnamed protein product [Trifolium pratense]
MSNIEDNKELGQMDVDASEGSVNMPSSQQQEATLKKKYGGIVPKKPPLISKDHERAYFDSADWALGKAVRSPRDHLRLFGLNYSQHSNKHVTGNLLMLLRVKVEVFHLRMHLPMSKSNNKSFDDVLIIVLVYLSRYNFFLFSTIKEVHYYVFILAEDELFDLQLCCRHFL